MSTTIGRFYGLHLTDMDDGLQHELTVTRFGRGCGELGYQFTVGEHYVQLGEREMCHLIGVLIGRQVLDECDDA
jgi:hypothetical protein